MRDLILVDHLLLLHLLDSNHFVSLPIPANSDLSKCSSTNDLLRNEVSNRNLSPLQAIVLWLLMEYLLFDELLLLIWEIHLIHLMLELVPCVLSLFFFILGFRIFVLDIGFCWFSFLACLGWGLDWLGGAGGRRGWGGGDRGRGCFLRRHAIWDKVRWGNLLGIADCGHLLILHFKSLNNQRKYE